MMNRAFNIAKLKLAQDNIKFESAEDEGAAEYYAELQSVVDTLSDKQNSDSDIQDSADNVGWILE